MTTDTPIIAGGRDVEFESRDPDLTIDQLAATVLALWRATQTDEAPPAAGVGFVSSSMLPACELAQGHR